MEDINKLNKLYSYAFYAAGVAAIIAAATLSNGIFLVSGALLVLIAAIYLNSGHMVNNLLIKKSKMILIQNGYQLGRSLSSAVRKDGDSYTGVSIAIFSITKAVDGRDAFEPIINNIRDPFEFSVSMKEVDKQRLVESLETKKRMKEIHLSRVNPKTYNKANQIRKELEIINKEIANITKGDKSLEIIVKLKSIKASKDRIEAELEPPKSLARIANAFCTALGLDYRMLSGEELMENLA